MKAALLAVFLAFESAMIAATVWASLERPVWDVGAALLSDRWFQATLLDAYLGFLTFYVWVLYKERGALPRIAWFVLIVCLGNMAIAAYVLMQVVRWRESDGIHALLLRR